MTTTEKTTGIQFNNCSVLFSDIDDFRDVELTEELLLQWPCEVLKYYYDLQPLVKLVKLLLNQGSSAIVGLGFVFNILAFVTFMQEKMRRVSMGNYLAVLAIYDSMVLIFNFLIGVLRGQIESVNATFQQSEALCILHSIGVELFTMLSVWIIVCVTAERALVVIYPLKASNITVSRARKTIAWVSLIILLFSCSKGFVTGFEGDSVFGYAACLTNRAQNPALVYMYVAISTWIPTFTILGLNITILYVLNRDKKKLGAINSDAMSRKQAEREGKLTIMLLTLTFSFLFLILPLGIVQSAELYWNNVMKVPPSGTEPNKSEYIFFFQTKLLLKWVRAFFFFLYQFNYAINLFLYCISGDKFKRVFVSFAFCLPETLGQSKASMMGSSMSSRGTISLKMSNSTLDVDNAAATPSPTPPTNPKNPRF
ncbi:uncharacterized protein LOC135495039 [Lineus longissimus]|uniref:uncharacterized protein LOC135495039 n=1 Tax=Lineus longissimus TaxID=88925 RepID=UPI00315DA1B4